MNYTRAHLDSNGGATHFNGTFTDFITETIECAPLQGELYLVDRLLVFNMLISFTTGQPSGNWIKTTTRHSDGRRSMQALHDHFAGEGNQYLNIFEADCFKESLHYKSERAIALSRNVKRCSTSMTRKVNLCLKRKGFDSTRTCNSRSRLSKLV